MSLFDRSTFSHQIQALRGDAHQAVIRYFEKHEQAIRRLDEDEYIDILVIYLDSLFECGAYEKVLNRIDEAIHLAIDRQIYTLQDEDLYQHLLFRKAAAAYNLDNLPTCIHILRELLRIRPDHLIGGRFLRRCLVRQSRRWRQRWRAMTILLLLTSVAVIVLETFYVRPFLPAWTDRVEWLRNGLFLAGVLTLVGSEIGLFVRAHHQVSRVRQQGWRRRRPVEKSHL